MISREQFMAAAGVFYDMIANGGGAPSAGGTGDGRSPKFDTAIHRKGGMIQWASECSLKELSYWREQAGRPPSDPKYAEKNAKQAKSLDYWIAYRRAEPNATWTGERNRATVTAKPPSDKPAQYQKDATPAPDSSRPTPSFDDADSYGFDNEEPSDDLPF